mmetsp:Transcript_38121/g.104968  ORF Transcript_38121/g.104968 Transcript_38121/m.104968 type:complete len:377 (+) Transcript_38121:136-1266(+)
MQLQWRSRELYPWIALEVAAAAWVAHAYLVSTTGRPARACLDVGHLGRSATATFEGLRHHSRHAYATGALRGIFRRAPAGDVLPKRVDHGSATGTRAEQGARPATFAKVSIGPVTLAIPPGQPQRLHMTPNPREVRRLRPVGSLRHEVLILPLVIHDHAGAIHLYGAAPDYHPHRIVPEEITGGHVNHQSVASASDRRRAPQLVNVTSHAAGRWAPARGCAGPRGASVRGVPRPLCPAAAVVVLQAKRRRRKQSAARAQPLQSYHMRHVAKSVGTHGASMTIPQGDVKCCSARQERAHCDGEQEKHICTSMRTSQQGVVLEGCHLEVVPQRDRQLSIELVAVFDMPTRWDQAIIIKSACGGGRPPGGCTENVHTGL